MTPTLFFLLSFPLYLLPVSPSHLIFDPHSSHSLISFLPSFFQSKFFSLRPFFLLSLISFSPAFIPFHPSSFPTSPVPSSSYVQPSDYSGFLGSGSRASSRASSARASPVVSSHLWMSQSDSVAPPAGCSQPHSLKFTVKLNQSYQ